MGWFDEQIRQRKEKDQQVLEDSFVSMMSAVLNKWETAHLEDGRFIGKAALDDILKYYHLPPVELPEGADDLTEKLESVLRPTGLMVREVDLDEGWQKDACGPMLGTMREGGQVVALIPSGMFGYHYRDPKTGKRRRITRRNARLFEREALSFYRPMPMKRLGVHDLLLYMKSCISRGDIVLTVLAALALTLVGMIEPRVYHLITGKVLEDKRMNLLIGLGVFLLSSAFAAQLVGLIRSFLMERINIKVTQSVEASVMMRILSLPVSFFRGFSSGELANRASSVSSLCSMILNNILSVGLSSLMSLLYVSQIFSFAPSLVWPSILIILSTVILSVAASLVQIGITRKQMKLAAKESGMSYAILNGVQKIRLSGSEKRVFARWGRLYAKQAKAEYDPPIFLKLNGVLVTAISLIGTIVLYYMAVKAGVGESEYYAFSAAYGRVMGAFSALAGIAISVAGIKPVLEMAEPILSAVPESAADKEPVPGLSGSIEINHVCFRYEENSPYVLNDLDLKIKAGEYVAIVGRTGCGKSTLVRLLLGFEKPQKGTVFYDQYDLDRVDPCSVRKQIGVVIQNGQLFQGDIYSNIVISAPKLSMDDAWEAAELAGIAQDIREMPMGMHTMISEGQGGISGGQKQRLMIARAVAPKPRILIFDEATSALDNKTQRQVSEALDGLHCTRIVIAHRLSTIRNCDRILVMDNGGIAEEGSYEELIRKNGYFAELVDRQRLDKC